VHFYTIASYRGFRNYITFNWLIGISTGIAKLDRKNISSATIENYIFSLFLLEYIHMTIIYVKAYVRAQMLISVLLRMQNGDYTKVNIIAIKLQTQKILNFP